MVMTAIPLLVILILMMIMLWDDLHTEQTRYKHKCATINGILARNPYKLSITFDESEKRGIFELGAGLMQFLEGEETIDEMAAEFWLKSDVSGWCYQNISRMPRVIYDSERLSIHLLFDEGADAFAFRMRWL
jgi:hypothetical protein